MYSFAAEFGRGMRVVDRSGLRCIAEFHISPPRSLRYRHFQPFHEYRRNATIYFRDVKIPQVGDYNYYLREKQPHLAYESE